VKAVGTLATRASDGAVESYLSKKERKTRERLLQGIDRAARGVTYGVWGRVCLRAQRNAFFNRLSTAAKNAYMTLIFMDSELHRITESLAHMRSRRMQLEDHVLTLDRTVIEAAESAKRKGATAAAGSTTDAIGSPRNASTKSKVDTKASSRGRQPRAGQHAGDVDPRLRKDDASDSSDGGDFDPLDSARLSGLVNNSSAARAAAMGGGASMKASNWEKFADDTAGEGAPGMQIRSHVPPQDVYIPSPGHVISTNVNDRSRELLVRRGLLRHDA
jgi:hypothetical protein